MTCGRKRIKKNYNFGKKSKADKFCKDCGEVITNRMIIKMVKEKKARRKRWKQDAF